MAIANGTCVRFCNQPKAHFAIPECALSIAVNVTWEDSMLVKRIAACIPIYLQPFTSYSEILVGNCNFSLTLAFKCPRWGCFHWNSWKNLCSQKTRIMGYQRVKTVWRQIEPFRHNTSVRRTDRRTDVQPISVTCAVTLTHVKTRCWQLTCKFPTWWSPFYVQIQSQQFLKGSRDPDPALLGINCSSIS